MPLPINIQELIAGRIVESERIEYKEGWNPGSVYRSICAFANDFSNIGGGYIIIGIEENNGRPVRPIKGIKEEQIDKIQKEILGFNNLINPVYHPKVSIEEIDVKKILVLWVPGGSNRPYEVPEEIKSKEKRYYYYIRNMASTVRANKQQREELISLANQIPFDDRGNTQVDVNDISFTLLKEHLRLTGSKLLEWVDTHTKADILAQMELLSGPHELLYPRNVALMLFTDNPERFFPYSRVEIVTFPKGAADPEFTEASPISGPIPAQIRQTMQYLKTHVMKEKIKKIPGQSESDRIWNYPYAALEEAVANALYHRDYQLREPVEIRVYPDYLSILNYGGPDRSIKIESFNEGVIRPRRYRNRRLGDFLKELELTEGRATGIPTIRKSMRENGSPFPEFNTDEERSFFEVVFSVHEDFLEEKIEGGQIGSQMGGQIGSQIKLTERQKEVLELIYKNNYLSRKQLSEALKVNVSAAQKHIDALKEKGLIKREGGTRGHWKILIDLNKG